MALFDTKIRQLYLILGGPPSRPSQGSPRMELHKSPSQAGISASNIQEKRPGHSGRQLPLPFQANRSQQTLPSVPAFSAPHSQNYPSNTHTHNHHHPRRTINPWQKSDGRAGFSPASPAHCVGARVGVFIEPSGPNARFRPRATPSFLVPSLVLSFSCLLLFASERCTRRLAR